MTAYNEMLWDFPSPYTNLRRRVLKLRTLRSEDELFYAPKASLDEGVEISLPMPFLETAIVESRDGAWQEQPYPTDRARDLGLNMWMNVPAAIRDEITGSATPTLLKIDSTGCGVDDIPWEWLHTSNGPLALQPNVRLVRNVPVLSATPPFTVTSPLRVLIVATNPKDERLLNYNEEVRIIRTGLQNAHDYEVRELIEPRLEALAEALTSEPHILHYVGHAGISGEAGHVILHDEMHGTHWLSPAQLGTMLPASVRLLCLSTCVTAKNYQVSGLTRFAHAANDVALPTTIANQYALHPAASEAFWRAFYPALVAHGGNVVEAFHDAQVGSSLEAVQTIDWASFTLVLRDRTGVSFSLGQAVDASNARYAAEIQAQFAARFANDLADRLRYTGGDSGLKASLASAVGHLKEIKKAL
jgi:CHAT domain